jgi:hypothetical protein
LGYAALVYNPGMSASVELNREALHNDLNGVGQPIQTVMRRGGPAASFPEVTRGKTC